MNNDVAKTKHRTKSKFTPDEDKMLISLVQKYGDCGWVTISHHMKSKTSRQCRERWQNYLNPTLSATNWSSEDDKLLLEKQKELGCCWNTIARFFGDRSGNNVRNRWLMITRKEKKKLKIHQRNAKIDPKFIIPAIENAPILNDQITPGMNKQNTTKNTSTNQTPKTQLPQASNIFDIFCNQSLIDFEDEISLGFF